MDVVEGARRVRPRDCGAVVDFETQVHGHPEGLRRRDVGAYYLALLEGVGEVSVMGGCGLDDGCLRLGVELRGQG